MSEVQSAEIRRVTSKDGTPIAYTTTGNGPALIVVAAALADRTGTKKLTQVLAPHLTVVDYDRRGRGDSGDTKPYAVQREVEDIEALIDEVGGSARLFGSSSGALLALEAANHLSGKVERMVLFEPPLIVDQSRRPISPDLSRRVEERVSAGDRSGAVKLFMAELMGIPSVFVNIMRILPGWSAMKTMAHTIPYDLAVTADTAAGTPLPADRWAGATVPTLVLTGGRSPKFFRTGADQLAAVLPEARHEVLPGQTHASVVMRPKGVVPVLVDFLTG